jgi:hypothetical protein
MAGQQRKRQKTTRERGSRATDLDLEEAGEGGDQIGMEGFPLAVIGNILSHLDDVKDVVRASMTCRKWRVALRHHLHTLRHNYWKFLPGLEESKTEKLEFCSDGHNSADIGSPNSAHSSLDQLFNDSRYPFALAYC